MRRKGVFTFLLASCLALSAASLYAAEKAPPSQPQAKAWLKKMSHYLDTLNRYQVHIETTREIIYPRGGRLDENAYGDAFVQQHNRLRINLNKPNQSREIYYNGSTLSVYTPKLNYYGAIPTPPTTSRMLDKVMTEYGISMPLADILRPNFYGTVAPRIESGIVVGPSLLNGVYCKQLAFRSGDVDWQIWIEDSPTPLPRRIVIVDRGVKGNPRYMATLTHWNTNPTFESDLFTFTPPAGAQKIQFVKPGQAPAQRRPFTRKR
ncbi:MAG TPA: DUF2092 domain-containing protein [Armatimonadota bacterium]|nr:DUF2092 domain-containing protein [Armatimonadota bacterium]